MQAACLANLLLDKVVPVAPYLEIVLHLRVDGYDGLSDLHQRHPRLRINLRILIELVEDESILLDSAFIDAEEQVLRNHRVVHDLSEDLLGR